ncbi:hypothetical protein V2W45_1474722 [Cenococcum geophilum]
MRRARLLDRNSLSSVTDNKYIDMNSDVSRPKALLNLCYQYIIVTLIRDLKGGPHNIVLKFTFKFTKEYLSIKKANTFPIPKIIFNPLLILSPYVFLLGLLFANKAFKAPNLTSAEQLSKLYIKPRRNKLPLPLRLDLDNIPIFRQLIKAFYGYEDLGTITGFRQIARPYSLRYSAGKAFNKNSNHANTQTFLKHYLSRRNLIKEQSLSVNKNPHICSLIKVRNKLKHSLKRKAAGTIINIKREDIKATLESCNNRLVKYKRLINIIITLPSTSLEDKIYRRNNAINTVVDYCNVKEEAAKALERAKASLYKEKRPKIYFICLRNQKLLIGKRTYKFYTPATLTKHFRKGHLSKLLQ